jgi:autotransporter family porin
VRARPDAENKGMNRPFDDTRGQRLGPRFLAGDNPAADQLLVPRVDGDFTGTTEEILRWAACKWGIDQNIVFAQAAAESWWQQTTKGDWAPDGCPPGHPPSADGKPGLCPQSWGILQNKYRWEQSSWPAIGRSTAMNADTAYAIWRSCFDGYETWLITVPHDGTYHAGDAWGCVGRWYSGQWLTAPAQRYISEVRSYLRERIWTTPAFQQPS